MFSSGIYFRLVRLILIMKYQCFLLSFHSPFQMWYNFSSRANSFCDSIYRHKHRVLCLGSMSTYLLLPNVLKQMIPDSCGTKRKSTTDGCKKKPTDKAEADFFLAVNTCSLSVDSLSGNYTECHTRSDYIIILFFPL